MNHTSPGEPTTAYPADTLGMAPEEMRRLGYKVVDLVVERLQQKQTEPVIQTGIPNELMQALGGTLPETPQNPDESLQLLTQIALTYQQHGDHPRYFARVAGPSSFAAVLGEWLATGFNAMAASWGGGSGPAMVELVVIEWLRQLIGLPAGTEGVLMSGGSLANLTAFLTARSELGQGVAYFTDQTHSSLVRDLRALGWPEHDLHQLDSDDQFQMPITALQQAIAADKQAGKRPMIVIATAGTTNTGSVDPLPEIAELCTAENMWFHIDGAYGGPAAITPQGRQYLTGLERADSVILDPHKWLFQPYDVGACLVTRPGALERCFTMTPEYLRDVQAKTGEVNFANRSLELSRRSRAIKIWLSLRTYGAEKFRQGVQHSIELAEFAEQYLRQQPDIWEIASPAQIGIVCFALKNWQPGEHAARAQALSDTGFACVTSTFLKGRSVLRLCIINPLTTQDDIVQTIDRLAQPV